MTCPTCNRAMVMLFTSTACDWCEGKTALKTGELRVGYVVWRGFLGTGFPHYVFIDEGNAWRWKIAQGQAAGEIRRIVSTDAFVWRDGRGAMRDIRFADHLFEIFPDNRFRQAPHRAWLAPVGS